MEFEKDFQKLGDRCLVEVEDCDFIHFFAGHFKERCQSGRSSTLGKRVYRKVTRVRIPPSPQSQSIRT